MEYRLGTGIKIKDSGETVPLVCPKCDNKVQFHLFSNIENRFPFLSQVMFISSSAQNVHPFLRLMK